MHTFIFQNFQKNIQRNIPKNTNNVHNAYEQRLTKIKLHLKELSYH